MPETLLSAYHAMLAGRGMKVGDQVFCDFRMPCAHQWWVAPLWVGVIEEPGTDAGAWNGTNSEATYCARLLAVRVRYLSAGLAGLGEFVQHDPIGHLRQWHGTELTVSPCFNSDASGYSELRTFAAWAGLLAKYPARHLEAVAA